MTVIASGKFDLNSDYVESNYPNLKIFALNKSKYSFIGFAFNCLRVIKSHKLNPSILISGDPVYGFFAAKTLIILLKRRVPIQIQMHGDLVFSFSKNRIFFTLKSLIILMNIHFADSIRLVAPHQQMQLKRFSSKLIRRCFIAPIPVHIPQEDYSQRYFEEVHVGFLGRLHKERGIRNFVSIAKEILAADTDAKILIAGVGPELDFMKSNLLDSDFVTRVNFLGFVSGSKKEDFFRDCSVLLSTAPTESFGMSIRESVLRGVPVIALANTGTRVFKQNFPDSVQVCADDDGAIQALRGLEKCTLSEVTVAHNRNEQQHVNIQAVNALVDSWARFETN